METITKRVIYLYGASGHGKVVAEIAENLGFETIIFLDDDASLDKIWDYPVLHEIPKSIPHLCLTLGNNYTRKKLAQKFSHETFGTLISPSSNISKRIKIGAGTVVMSGVSINADVQIGRHCILNTNASVDHDCELEDFVHVSPNASLAGNVSVGEGAHIGIGASIIQGVTIGKWAMIGAGAVILSDVPDFAVVVGNPGKIIKYQKNPETTIES
ncbi:acetyltransferase [Moheibacter stercoris]|uniref:Acetyltransferase EpsM n=1 Tax=Moheibacter stercoris TaxID=1628251 RepID=A0ABV2LQ28_9FLAO